MGGTVAGLNREAETGAGTATGTGAAAPDTVPDTDADAVRVYSLGRSADIWIMVAPAARALSRTRTTTP